MKTSSHFYPNLWSVILAGGEGRRMSAMVQQWHGRHVPKQYCAFVGTRSMLAHTIERADALAPANQKLTVIDREHRHEAWGSFEGVTPGTIVLQPENRDTAAGIFLPLTYIHHLNPHATVAIYPSDHFIHPNHLFVETVKHAVLATDEFPDRVFLLGAKPDYAECEYGWIQPGAPLPNEQAVPLWTVQSFIEKPAFDEAHRAFRSGALWNTLIIIAKLDTLWELGRHCFPDLVSLFAQFQPVIGTTAESTTLKWMYQTMPVCNFSHGLLQQASDHIAVMPLDRVTWNDWGNPKRVAQTLQQLGKMPAFSLSTMTKEKQSLSLSGAADHIG